MGALHMKFYAVEIYEKSPITENKTCNRKLRAENKHLSHFNEKLQIYI